jgi:hypothetical protein
MANFFQVRGLKRIDLLSTWLTVGLQEAVNHPATMQPMVHAFADSISAGFGGGVRRSEVEWGNANASGAEWQPLSRVTRVARKRRGYPADGPILQQSGQLKKAGLDPFVAWGKNWKRSSRSYTAPYNRFTGPVTMRATNFNGVFHAQISGKRVQNQYGGKIPRAQYRWGTRDRFRKSALPKREFWFLKQRSFDERAPDMLRALTTQWESTVPTGLRAR